MSIRQPKTFGIGLSKTGTSSLAQALVRLGFKTKDYMGVTRYVPGDLSSIDMDTVLGNDALTDTPIPSFYKELDARFPGSKFILTVRDREGWLQSCRKQFNERHASKQNDAHARLFADLYGTAVFDEQRFAAGYERFVAGVLEYFKDRPQDLLILNVAAGDGWEKLCPFLGKAVPDVPFPKANVTQITWMNVDDLVGIAEAAGRELLNHYRGRVKAEMAGKGIVRPPNAARLLRRGLDLALGRDAADVAAEAAHKLILAKLAKLSLRVPVLSPMAHNPAYAERRGWNHVWLVDPLDGQRAFASGSGDFTVNIALVEDGRPIYGVVHSPALGVTYFGRTGKGAFKRTAAGETLRLSPRPFAMPEAEARNAVEAGDAEGSRSLAMCRLIEQPQVTITLFGPTMEWKAAAAQAVLLLADVHLVASESGTEPIFNSRELTVGALEFQAGQPA